MHVRGIASQQDPPVAIGSRLASHVGEPGDRDGTVDPVIGPVYRDERLADIAQRRFAADLELLFRQHDAHRPAIVQFADRVGAGSVLTQAPRRLLDHLDFGDQPALGRIPPSEVGARGFTDHAASSVASDEVFRPQRRVVGQLDGNARVVLREASHLASAIDQQAKLVNPAGQDALDVLLPECEEVTMPSW